jgi:hypothetical protein
MRYQVLMGMMSLTGSLVLLLTQLANAQQTIFNVPSADITPKGKLFLQHEAQFKSWHANRFLSNTEYSAYGIGHYTELDATVFNISAPASGNVALGLGFKTAIPLFDTTLPKEEIKLTAGSMLPISLQGNGFGNWSYSHLSVRVPKAKTRLTAGASVGSRQIFGRETACFMGGFEQPLTKQVTVIADWYSGTHALGLFTPGISVTLPKEANLYMGYQIPNNRQSGNQGFVVELSKFF